MHSIDFRGVSFLGMQKQSTGVGWLGTYDSCGLCADSWRQDQGSGRVVLLL